MHPPPATSGPQTGCATGPSAAPPQRILLVHAHPDDEVFATGATAAWLSAQGSEVHLRVATGGEASETRINPDLTLTQARDLRAHRLSNSCQALGLTSWGWLTSPGRWIDADTHAPSHPDPAPEHGVALHEADLADVARAITRTIEELRPDCIITVGSDGLTGHPDHIAINRAVRAAVSHITREQPHGRRRSLTAYGAVLPAHHIHAGHALLATYLPGQTIGSGRVRGIAASPGPRRDDSLHAQLLRLTTDDEAGRRKQQALDAYTAGLGTRPLAALLQQYPGRGDSLLLRAVAEATSWNVEHFQTLAAA